MGGFAWVTLATNDSYSLGALVLAHSLKQVGAKDQLAVLVTAGVTTVMREKLASVFNVVQEVNILDSRDEANLRLLKRPELGVTFTKLHCWRLTQFDKCVFLDADTLVLQNCDELFEREELSAAPDVGWPDCFNSGVFVYRPSNETYEKLVQFALEKGSFDGGDQGLLNLYFSDWVSKDIGKHLPFIYNLCSTACYSYLPAFKQFGKDAKIIHFIGATKPWLQYFNTETRKVQPSNDLRHLEVVLQQWWNIFCSLIHPNLTTEMARNRSDNTHTSTPNHTPITQKIRKPKMIILDPWNEYEHRQSSVQQVPQPDPFQTPTEPQNTNVKIVEDCHLNCSQSPMTQSKPLSDFLHSESLLEKPQPLIGKSSIIQPQCQSQSYSSIVQPPQPLAPQPLILDPKSQYFVPEPQPYVIEPRPEPEPSKPNMCECEAAVSVCNKTTLQSLEDETEGGLAGAFAQLTLGSPRTAEQTALDDHLRRQGWEVGNIDYMGRDSFDNIWSKICETLGTELKVQESAPTPVEEKPVEPASEAVTQPPPAETLPSNTLVFDSQTPAATPQSPLPLQSTPDAPTSTTIPDSSVPQCPLQIEPEAQTSAPTDTLQCLLPEKKQMTPEIVGEASQCPLLSKAPETIQEEALKPAPVENVKLIETMQSEIVIETAAVAVSQPEPQVAAAPAAETTEVLQQPPIVSTTDVVQTTPTLQSTAIETLQKTVEVSKPAVESQKLEDEPLKSDSLKLPSEPSKADTESATSAVGILESVTEPSKQAAESSKPVVELSKEVAEPPKLEADASKPKEESLKLLPEHVKTSESILEEVAPQPIVEPQKLVVAPKQLASEASKPAAEASKEIAEPTKRTPPETQKSAVESPKTKEAQSTLSSTSSTSPTPPPRKSGGGGKKSKGKK